MDKNIGILLSGGAGTRINTDIPKQYVRLNDRMIVTYALEPMLKSSYIDLVYIVANQEWRESIIRDLESAGLDTDKVEGFANPGANRQGSIFNAMRIVPNDYRTDDSTVLVHDAARPRLTAQMIEECYAGLPGHDGVMPVLPMKDTVYLSEDGRCVSKLLDRSKIFAGQAPELFRFKPYYEANERLVPDEINKINGASEPAIMAGMDIAMIPGDEGNFKITTDADMKRFMGGTS